MGDHYTEFNKPDSSYADRAKLQKVIEIDSDDDNCIELDDEVVIIEELSTTASPQQSYAHLCEYIVHLLL